MPNMSYCRFRNTLNDLRDCYYNMDSDDLSQEEFYARRHIIELCKSISSEYNHLLEVEYEEFFEEDYR